MLFSREIKNLTRDKGALGARLGLTTFLSLLIGLIFRGVGATDSSVQVNLQSHFGALIMVLSELYLVDPFCLCSFDLYMSFSLQPYFNSFFDALPPSKCVSFLFPIYFLTPIDE